MRYIAGGFLSRPRCREPEQQHHERRSVLCEPEQRADERELEHLRRAFGAVKSSFIRIA